MRRIAVALSVFLCAVALHGQELQKIPEPAGYVTDLADLLTPEEKTSLESTLRDFQAKKGTQIVVLIVPSTSPETIEDYSMRVVEKWKPGEKKIDNGILFTIALNDRRARIEVGYGLEGILPDVRAKRILENSVFPRFREKSYYAGIQGGVNEIIAILGGEEVPGSSGKPDWKHSETSPAPLPFWEKSTFGMPRFLLVLGAIMAGGLILRLILDQIMGAFLGHSVAATGTGVLGFLFAWGAMGQVMGIAFIYGLGLFVLVLLLGLGFFSFLLQILSIFGGEGGGSRGGFSGGGGDFGGGGASGGW